MRTWNQGGVRRTPVENVNDKSMTQTQTTVFIPTPLRAYTEKNSKVDVAGDTVGDALRDLVSRYPGLKPHLYDEQGKLRQFVNIFRNDEDIRHLERENTPLSGRDELSIVPSIAGGTGLILVSVALT